MESKIRCPKCNFENEADTTFCAECGTRIVGLYQIIGQDESAIVHLPFEQVKNILKNADRLGEKLIEYIPQDNIINKIQAASLKAITIQKTIFAKSKVIQEQKDEFLLRILLGNDPFYYKVSINHDGLTKISPSGQIEGWVKGVNGGICLAIMMILIGTSFFFCCLFPLIIPLFFLMLYLAKTISVKKAKKYLKPLCNYIQDN